MSVANIYTFCGYSVAALLMSLNRQVLSSEESSKNIQSNMYGSTAKAISHYKDIENFWESENLWKLLCGNLLSLRHIARFRVQSQWAMTVWIASGEKKFRLFLFFYCWLSKVVKIMGLLCRKVTLNCLEAVEIFLTSRPRNYYNLFVLSLWDWLLAAWIYEELFDDGSDTTSHDNTRDYDSSYDYDDYEENYWWISTRCIEIMFNFVRNCLINHILWVHLNGQ